MLDFFYLIFKITYYTALNLLMQILLQTNEIELMAHLNIYKMINFQHWAKAQNEVFFWVR